MARLSYLFIQFVAVAIAAVLVLPAQRAAAQELLVNRSFESPVTPANGNNFYATIPNWTVTSVVPAQTLPFNVIRPWSGYAGNPTATPTGGGVQYLDINAASGIIRQTVTVPSAGMLDFSGWFSVRDNQQALSGLTINIRNSSGVIIATQSTSFLASDPIGLWKRASSANVPVTAGTYTYEAVIPNPVNFDLASLVFKPNLAVSKTSSAYFDPVNNTVSPKAIPGGIVEYLITTTSPASYSVDSNSIRVVDATPSELELVVGGFASFGSGPAAFTAGATGLSYTYTSLASTSDHIDFSNNGGASWTYTPVANAQGTDPNVTNIRLRPQGVMNPGSTFSFRLRFRIK